MVAKLTDITDVVIYSTGISWEPRLKILMLLIDIVLSVNLLEPYRNCFYWGMQLALGRLSRFSAKLISWVLFCQKNSMPLTNLFEMDQDNVSSKEISRDQSIMLE